MQPLVQTISTGALLLSALPAHAAFAWHTGRHPVAVPEHNLPDRVQAIGKVELDHHTGFYNEPRVPGVDLAVRL